jgi:flagellar basal-body rod protein FlgG
MSTLSSFQTDLSTGNFIKTGAPLDLAVDGSGFIALEGNGYTKRGDLKRNGEGFLTTSSDVRVLGNNGPIRLPDGKIEITDTGEISVDSLPVDTIKIVDFAKRELLTKRGDGMFATAEPGSKSKATVRQGYLETSNIEPIKEMVKMIDTLRDYQTYQKAIQTFDDAASRANDMGRL